MDLFERRRRQQTAREAPLAARMRPRGFDEFVGQEHLIGPDRVLRKAIEADQVPSMVLWGPPGSGKTTLAYLIASLTRSHFEPVSAVTAGVADLRRIVEQARERRALHGQRTILFVDEIHRFNKAQQDVILPHVEDGVVTFIGATTENPSFEVISPLLSRSRVFSLEPLTPEQVRTIVERALEDVERGLGDPKVELAPEALDFLVQTAGGDARVALNTLELAGSATRPGPDGLRRIPLETVADALQKPALLYDRAGDQHYDTISAFIKSVRGSDPDAAVYWLTRMLEAGEDPLFIARRLVILAAEDIGLAEPQALPVAVAAYQAVHFVGLPEGAIPLAEATVYLATAPKSNTAYMALQRAREEVRRSRHPPVPLHLRNPVTSLMKQKDYGKGYKYAHDFPGHFVEMDFLPEALKGKRFYYPAEQGYEKEIAQRLRQWWQEKKSGASPPEG
ncbi:MAG: replication-associated recombination protein A [Chloroflexota bacterium]